MGYACPVCEVPQRDGEHLANHLAFTAVLRGGDHETWLDEHAPDWGQLNPERLADEVRPHADETAYEEVFEDTAAGDPHGHAHDHGRTPDRPHLDAAGFFEGASPAERGTLADEAQAILAEAEELTREMYGMAGEAEGDGNGDDGRDTAGPTDDDPTDDDSADADRKTQ